MKQSAIVALASSTLALGLAASPARAEGGAAYSEPPPSLSAAVAAPAPAPLPADAPPLAPPPAERSSRPEITLGVGVRGMVLPSAGFDPYATTDALAQGSFLAEITLVKLGPASILLFAEYAIGARKASARGQEASLSLHRLAGGAETRVQIAKRFYLAAKLAPMAYHLRGTITDDALDRPLVSRTWTWGLDVAGGAGLLLGRTGERGASFWLTADLGFTFAGESSMSYAPAPSDEDPRTYGSVSLPPFKPAGGSGRFGFAVAF